MLSVGYPGALASENGLSTGSWLRMRVAESRWLGVRLKSVLPMNSSTLSWAVPFGVRTPLGLVGIGSLAMKAWATGTIWLGAIIACEASSGFGWKYGCERN